MEKLPERSQFLPSKKDPFARLRRVDSLHDVFEFTEASSVIGSGAFGTVYRALHREAHVLVALKVLSLKQMDSKKALKDVARELKMLNVMNHDGICGLVDAVQTPDEIGIAMTLVDGSLDLASFLRKRQRLSEAHAALIAYQLLKSLDYLHNVESSVHHDLKPDNLVVSGLHGLLHHQPEHRRCESEPNGDAGGGKKVSDTHHATDATADAERPPPGAPLDDLLDWGRVIIVDFGFSRKVECCSAAVQRPFPSDTTRDAVKHASAGGAKSALLSTVGCSKSPTAATCPPLDQVNQEVGVRSSDASASTENSSTMEGDECDGMGVLLTPCGSDRYLPLEVIRWLVHHEGRHFRTTVERAKKIDCYSVGVVVYIMLSGHYPYNAKSRVTLELQLARSPPRMASSAWERISEEGKDFVLALLKQEVDERSSVTQALHHPWIVRSVEELPRSVREFCREFGSCPRAGK